MMFGPQMQVQHVGTTIISCIMQACRLHTR
mgnify:CR=1 FL=1